MPTTLTLGRDPAADIIIGDPSISRRHAELVLLDDRRIFVRDLGGANGTIRIRSGERLTVQREIVAPGDDVSFGDVVLSFDALKQMMLDKLGRDGRAASPDPLARVAADAQDARDAADAAAHRGGPGGGAAPQPRADHAGGGNARESRPDLGVFVPVFGGGLSRMRERGLLIPGLAFAIFVSRMTWLLSQPGGEARASFVTEFALAVVFMAFVVVYRLCGKTKPWLVILGVMAAETALMSLHPVLSLPFCEATNATAIIWQNNHAGGVVQPRKPVDVPQTGGKQEMFHAFHEQVQVKIPAGVVYTPGVPIEKPSIFKLYWAYFTCAGLLEELMKMLPVFGLIWASSRSTRADAKKWGVFEPLDAIVYACAAATMFIVLETLGSGGYVGGHLEDARKNDTLLFEAMKIFPLALFRTLRALCGHLAYSGYFAYLVGLGVMRPKQRERLWIGGWIMAAAIHGLWDTISDDTGFLPTLTVFIAFFFLITAILQARKLSPTRDENFATRALPRERRA